MVNNPLLDIEVEALIQNLLINDNALGGTSHSGTERPAR